MHEFKIGDWVQRKSGYIQQITDDIDTWNTAEELQLWLPQKVTVVLATNNKQYYHLVYFMEMSESTYVCQNLDGDYETFAFIEPFWNPLCCFRS